MEESPMGENFEQIVVWTRLRVPIEEIDTEKWIGYLQPMAKAPDHCGSSWAKIEGRPDTALLVTLWRKTSAMKEFRESPSAQLFWENLAANGIRSIGSYETDHYGVPFWFFSLQVSYLQLFWVYFETPMTEDHRERISNLRGIQTPALGFSVPRSMHSQILGPRQIWTKKTEIMHGTETKLMLWSHFWVNPEKAKRRHALETVIFSQYTADQMPKPDALRYRVKELGAIECQEEFCYFKRASRV